MIWHFIRLYSNFLPGGNILIIWVMNYQSSHQYIPKKLWFKLTTELQQWDHRNRSMIENLGIRD